MLTDPVALQKLKYLSSYYSNNVMYCIDILLLIIGKFHANEH